MSDVRGHCKFPGCDKATAVRVSVSVREAVSSYDTPNRGPGRPLRTTGGPATWSLCEEHKDVPLRAAQAAMTRYSDAL
jgi:hypothetical protein